MRIDPKYFIPFILVLAMISAILITYYTVSSRNSQRRTFRKHILEQDSLRYGKMPLVDGTDSLSVTDYKGYFVVLDFWSTWSDFSHDSHKYLARIVDEYSDTLKVIAAVVEDKKPKVQAYIKRHGFPFVYVEGTGVFNKNHVPGIPAQLVYNPSGNLISIFFGYRDSTQYDSLRTLIHYGR